MTYSIPYSFIPGTKARAQEVNANFNALNTNLDLLDTKKANTDFSNLSSEAISVIKNNSSHRNIGELIFSPIPLNDSGLHLLDGSKIQKEGIYENFVKLIESLYNENPLGSYFTTEIQWQASVTTYGECGKFVYDGVNNTVRLPKVTGKIDGTTDINALGDLEPLFVRLPDITGNFAFSGIDPSTFNGSASGAFTKSNADGAGNGHNAPVGNSTISYSFNASRSSSVYSGNGSDTAIHEQAIKMFVYIVIANSTKTDIQVDIDQVATDLNGKADTDLTNTTDTGKILMGGMAMPSSRYIDLTLGASGSTYTAPADGYVFLVKTSGGFEYISINTESMSSAQAIAAAGWTLQAFLPVAKGKVFSVTYNASGATVYFRFVYAQGSESEAQ